MSEKKLYYRYLSDVLPQKDSGKRIVLITGARQTGKTTLAKIKYPELRYINLDLIENREVLRDVSALNWHRDVGIYRGNKIKRLSDKIWAVPSWRLFV